MCRVMVSMYFELFPMHANVWIGQWDVSSACVRHCSTLLNKTIKKQSIAERAATRGMALGLWHGIDKTWPNFNGKDNGYLWGWACMGTHCTCINRPQFHGWLLPGCSWLLSGSLLDAQWMFCGCSLAARALKGAWWGGRSSTSIT